MYYTIKELASVYGCSERTISRRVAEMEKSGLYPKAVLAGAGRLRVDDNSLLDFLQRRRREKWKTKEEACGRMQ